jgi:hypothetical protein
MQNAQTAAMPAVLAIFADRDYLHFLRKRSFRSSSPSMSHSSHGMFRHQRSRGLTSHGSGT